MTPKSSTGQALNESTQFTTLFEHRLVADLLNLEFISSALSPRYEDDVWDLSGLSNAPRNMNPGMKIWRFDQISNPRWRLVAKDVAVATLNPSLVDALQLQYPALTSRRRTSPVTWSSRLIFLTRWLNWLTRHGVVALDAVTQTLCDRFIWGDGLSLRVNQTSKPGTIIHAIHAMRSISRCGRLPMIDHYSPGFTPWGDKPAADITGQKRSYGENSIGPVATSVFQPLLMNCLYMVDEISHPLVPELEDLKTWKHQEGGSSTRIQQQKRASGLSESLFSRLDRHLDFYRRSEFPLPEAEERIVRARRRRGWKENDPVLKIDIARIFENSNVRQYVSTDLPVVRAILEPLVLKVGTIRPFAIVPIRVRHLATGEMVPWRAEPLSASEIRRHGQYLLGACMVVTAALTGMRRSELMEITSESILPPTTLPGGGERYRLSSKVIKARRFGGDREEWVIIQEVHSALRLASSLAEVAAGEPIFGKVAISKFVNNFRQWSSEPFAERLGMHAIPNGPVNATALRRGLAQELGNRPNGLLAAKTHLKHISVSTTEGYAFRPGGAQAILHSEIKREEDSAKIRLVEEAYAQYRQGVLPAGRGAEELISIFGAIDGTLPIENQPPVVISSNRRMEPLIRSLAAVLHSGPANFCFFKDPKRALCLRLAGTTDVTKPLIGNCDSARCSQATHHPRHRDIWNQHAESLSVFLGNPRVPKGAKANIRAEYERCRQVISDIDSAGAARRISDENAPNT